MFFMLSTSSEFIDLTAMDTKPFITTCIKCGRPLSSKESIDRGYGPRCWLGYQEKSTESQFDIIK